LLSLERYRVEVFTIDKDTILANAENAREVESLILKHEIDIGPMLIE